MEVRTVRYLGEAGILCPKTGKEQYKI